MVEKPNNLSPVWDKKPCINDTAKKNVRVSSYSRVDQEINYSFIVKNPILPGFVIDFQRKGGVIVDLTAKVADDGTKALFKFVSLFSLILFIVTY